MNPRDQFSQHVLPTYSRAPLVPVRGDGARLWDADGIEYLDFCMGIAVCSLGHCEPRLVAALREQAGRLIHCSNLYEIPQQAALAEEINLHHVKMPGKVFFSNSGAEANDGLIKTARRYGHARPQPDGTPRFEVLTFLQSFHGRTLGSMAATGQTKIQVGFDPLLPGFRHLTFNDAAALAAEIRPETVAILVEPIQGEGGVHVATTEFLRAIATVCAEHDLLMFFDEVQVGFGRCGQSMAWREIAAEIEPDGISWAKGMGGGVPIGAFWISDRAVERENPSSAALSSLMGPGSHGSTYGGNPLVCAASLAVLTAIREDGLGGRASRHAEMVRETVAQWRHPAISEVRGLGLLLGIGLRPEALEIPPGLTPALALVAECRANGLLVPPAGPNAIRLLPPLNVTPDEISRALEIIRRSLDALTRKSSRTPEIS